MGRSPTWLTLDLRSSLGTNIGAGLRALVGTIRPKKPETPTWSGKGPRVYGSQGKPNCFAIEQVAWSIAKHLCPCECWVTLLHVCIGMLKSNRTTLQWSKWLAPWQNASASHVHTHARMGHILVPECQSAWGQWRHFVMEQAVCSIAKHLCFPSAHLCECGPPFCKLAWEFSGAVKLFGDGANGLLHFKIPPAPSQAAWLLNWAWGKVDRYGSVCLPFWVDRDWTVAWSLKMGSIWAGQRMNNLFVSPLASAKKSSNMKLLVSLWKYVSGH